jgi:hypothetical protein
MTEQREQMTEEEVTRSDRTSHEQQRANEGETEGRDRQAASLPGLGDEEASGSQAVGSQRTPGATASPSESDSGEGRAPLLAAEEAERFRQRWEDLQAGFVDQPRQMVEQADELVGDLIQQLTVGFSDKRSKLEAQWDKGDEVSTEELRVALTRYRSFFNRILSV